MNPVTTPEGTFYIVDADETRAKVEAACEKRFGLSPEQFMERWRAGTLEGDPRIARRIAMFLG